MKQLACLIGLFALFTVAPVCIEASAKQAPAQQQDRAQRGSPAQKQTAAQKAPAKAQGPAQGQASQPAGSPAPPPPPEEAPVGPALDKLSASLKQIEANLERHDLTDAELQALRQQIDPISGDVAGVIERLTPLLEHFQDAWR